jgi:hypothetical protein
MSKLVKDKRLTPKRNNYDNMPANATQYEKRKLMKEQIKKCRKSPDINEMYSVSMPGLKIVYYFQTREKLDDKVLELTVTHPERELIVKNPLKPVK